MSTTTIRRMAIVAMLVISLVALAIAPTLMPDSYSWLDHSVSESGAQGIEGAWLARLGFLMFGFAVLLLAGFARDRWGLLGALAHRLFGVSMIACAAFSHSPWEAGVPFDRFEDSLHSVAAFGVGLGFTVGVIFVTLRRGSIPVRVFDWLAIIAGMAIPMFLFNTAGYGGIAQRALFVIGALWYGAEAIRTADASPIGSTSRKPVMVGRG